MKRLFVIFTLSLAALALAACNSGPAPVEFTIEMSEFAFTPNTFEVQVGQEVTIHLKNIGALSHELMIGQNVEMMNEMPNTFEHNLFENEEPVLMGGPDDHSADSEVGGMGHGYMIQLPAKSDDATLTFTVTEDMVGEWQIGCFTDGGSHFNQGMTGSFIVKP